MMAAHALLETARDALFLARLPPSRLAWVYLAIAAVSMLLYLLEQRRGTRGARAGLASWLVMSAIVDVLFWVLIDRPATWTLYALYTWSGVFASLVVVRFWSLLGDLFTTGQAKRLFSLIGAGGVGGAIVGASVARILATTVDARHLLLASAAVLVATALATRTALPGVDSSAAATGELRLEQRDRRSTMPTIWLSPFLRRVAGIVALSATALTLVDYIFKSAVASYVQPEQLGAFFATTYLALNTLSLAAQLFAVSWLLRRLSVNRVLSVLPILVIAATGAFVLGGGLVAALALKGFDGVLRHSLHRTALEVLYVPLTGALRSRVKGFIDVLGQRGGQAVASLCILGSAALTDSLAICAVVVIVLAVAWVRVAATLESHYLDLFRATLSDVAMRTRLEFPDMDLASLETLLRNLNSADDSEVVAALDMFAEQERVHLIPALILYHPSRSVVLRALELFTLSGRQDFLTILDRLLEHDDPEVRAAALRTHTWAFGPRQELFRRFAADPSPIVATTALLGLASYSGGDDASRARKSLDACAASGSHDERLALAQAIRFSPGAAHTALLRRLADTAEVDVRIAVLQAMREILSARFIPVLLPMLPIRALRREARATLVAIGTEALNQLDATLGDPDADVDVRLHAPRTISFFPPRPAAAVLLRHLTTTRDSALSYRILRALGRCRAIEPSLELDADALRRSLERALGEAFRLIERRLALVRGAADDPSRTTPVHGLLVDLLRHRQTLATERLFRLVGLLYPSEDARSLHRGVYDPSAKVRDSSRELLDHLLQPPLREVVVALVDDIADDRRLERADPYYTRRQLDYVDTLSDLLEHGDDGTAALIAYHAAEIGSARLARELQHLRGSSSQSVAVAVESALARLMSPEETDGT